MRPRCLLWLALAAALCGSACGPESGEPDADAGGEASAGTTGEPSESASASHDEEGGAASGSADDTASADGTGRGTTSASGGSDGSATGDAACFEQWSEPVAVVEATRRPGSDGMRLHFEYELGVVTLVDIAAELVVTPSDGPFEPGEVSGNWVELRDDDDETLYTQLFNDLIPESVEVAGAGQAIVCPEDGAFQLPNLLNDPAATQLVFFQEELDGEVTFETVEFLRFDLP